MSRWISLGTPIPTVYLGEYFIPFSFPEPFTIVLGDLFKLSLVSALLFHFVTLVHASCTARPDIPPSEAYLSPTYYLPPVALLQNHECISVYAFSQEKY